MTQLVFLETGIKKEPYTLSSIIAEGAGLKHHTATRLIRNHLKDFEAFGKVGFQIQPLKSGQSQKDYILNEQQAYLLITFMKNTEPVKEFKKALVSEFFVQKQALEKYRQQYKDSKPTQNALHRAIASHPKYKDSPKLSHLIANQNAYIARLASFGRVENKGDLTALELYEYERLEHLAIYNLASGLSLKESNKALRKAQRKIT